MANVEPGGTADLTFAPDGPAPAITFAVGTGYLGNAMPVLLAPLR